MNFSNQFTEIWSFPSPDFDETLDIYENTLDLMYDLDKEFLDSNKYNNQYVIGFHSLQTWNFQEVKTINEENISKLTFSPPHDTTNEHSPTLPSQDTSNWSSSTLLSEEYLKFRSGEPLCKKTLSKIQVFDSGISCRTFFQFSYDEIYLYLFYNSLKYCRDYKIDIIQIKIIDNVYTAIPKTFWLKIIQRKWKIIMKTRNNIILQRGTVYSQQYFQTYGKYPINLQILPTIHGMLNFSTLHF